MLKSRFGLFSYYSTLLPSENSRTITCTAFAYKGTHLEGGLSGLLSQDKAPDREPVNLATRVARLGS